MISIFACRCPPAEQRDEIGVRTGHWELWQVERARSNADGARQGPNAPQLLIDRARQSELRCEDRDVRGQTAPFCEVHVPVAPYRNRLIKKCFKTQKRRVLASLLFGTEHSILGVGKIRNCSGSPRSHAVCRRRARWTNDLLLDGAARPRVGHGVGWLGNINACMKDRARRAAPAIPCGCGRWPRACTR